MATKTEFKRILKEFGLTESELQAIYEDVAVTNSLVNNLLNITKIKLSDLSPHLLRQLPFQKEKDLAALETKKVEAEKAAQSLLKEQQDEAYYQAHFEELMVGKIDKGESLTEAELSCFVFEYGIETDYGSNSRWSRPASTVSKLCGRYYMTHWKNGLTEIQSNVFSCQPVEVKPYTYEKVITVTEWLPVNVSTI